MAQEEPTGLSHSNSKGQLWWTGVGLLPKEIRLSPKILRTFSSRGTTIAINILAPLCIPLKGLLWSTKSVCCTLPPPPPLLPRKHKFKGLVIRGLHTGSVFQYWKKKHFLKPRAPHNASTLWEIPAVN